MVIQCKILDFTSTLHGRAFHGIQQVATGLSRKFLVLQYLRCVGMSAELWNNAPAYHHARSSDALLLSTRNALALVGIAQV